MESYLYLPEGEAREERFEILNVESNVSRNRVLTKLFDATFAWVYALPIFNILPCVLFSFGMYHDTEKIGCSKRDGDTLHVMTPSFEVDAVGVAWSRCSRRDITNFLE